MRIAVIGVGGTGSAALYHLCKAGHHATGYEQFSLGHSQGSSHGESRIIRHVYPDPLYTHLMTEAYPLWTQLEQEAGESLFVRCGGIFFGTRGEPALGGAEAALMAARLPYERLNANETSERFPALRLRQDEYAIYHAESGFLRASRCVLAHARLAVELGATVHERTRVTVLHERPDSVVIVSDIGEHEFDAAVVTARPWMSRLLQSHGLPLTVTRQHIQYQTIATHHEFFEPGVLPVWIDFTANYYGFPADGVLPGVKVASHDMGPAIDPSEKHSGLDERSDIVAAYAAGRFPDIDRNVESSQSCLYTSTPDTDFIIDSASNTTYSPRLWIVSACSGHGFKFTTLLGKIAAELIEDQASERSLSRFRLDRFL